MRSNFVLWADGLDYYVTERCGVKRDSSLREHFVGFFETEASARKYAIARNKQMIETLSAYIKHHKRKMRK